MNNEAKKLIDSIKFMLEETQLWFGRIEGKLISLEKMLEAEKVED